jgi:aspartyl/asparaginyl-tRNA synthetase
LLGAGEELVVTRRGQPLALRRAGERQLIEMYGGAVWVTHPPAEAVPFYQAVDSEGCALSADLLFGVGEVVGCGQRQSTGDLVRASLEAHHVDPAPYHWYCTMKDHFPLQTAGFGLGLERYLLWLLCHDDVRDLHALPRMRGVPHFA